MFTLDFIVNLIIQNVGQEKAVEIKTTALDFADKMDEKKMYVVKKLKGRGVCLIITNSDDCKMNFPSKTKENPPDTIELETKLRGIDLD